MDLRADFLIIGSGIAALRATAELAGAGDVLILTKAEPREGNTGYAQGGIAAAVGADDSPDLHAADTIAAGAGLCDERAVQVLVEEGPALVRELMDWGVGFDKGPDGQPSLTVEGAHCRRRVLHASDATGREIARVLWARGSQLPGVRAFDHARVIDLVVEDGRCRGARFLADDGAEMVAEADLVLLATGGAGQVYSQTTNPAVATGDGVAMAYRAGAEVADLEFVQFHPTALSVPGEPRFLLSEALRGEGARLLNADGEPFMDRYDPMGDLAPRDRVSRGIAREVIRTGKPVYLSLQQLDPEFVHERFPLIAEACRKAGFDLARQPIPIGPAAHYVMGGAVTDLDGRTTIEGLYAAGEVACTGVHGANRLASNSLLEGLVFGARAGRVMRAAGSRVQGFKGSQVHGSRVRGSRVRGSQVHGSRVRGSQVHGSPVDEALAPTIQDVMWREVGMFRDRAGIERALAVLEPAWEALDGHLAGGGTLDHEGWRTASILTVGRLIARAAHRREESRGAHFRSDFPERDDIHWKRRLTETR